MDQGLEPGDGVCLFMDKIPSLYFAFLGVPKMGGLVQPLFCALREESLEVRLASAEARAILTTRKHVKKVRKIRDRLPSLEHVILDEGLMPARWYKFIEDNRVTVWYSAPTAVRSLMRDGAELVRQHDLSSLRHLASVGEPLDAEAVIWSEEVGDLSTLEDD